MVSRRSVRVKVMQLLYVLNRDAQMDARKILRTYDESIERSFELFLFNLYILINTAYEAVNDANKRNSKLLPSEDDQKFTARLYENEVVQSLVNNQNLEREFQRNKFAAKVDDNFYQKLYAEFVELEEYKAYLDMDPPGSEHTAILLELYRVMRKNEYFNEVLQDHYLNWVDDKSLAVGNVKKAIKELPADESFYEQYYPDHETAQEFGRSLLEKTCEHDIELLELIEPTLKNWDAERLAIIDMILLKMAICEFIHFPTIPTKVTLNEYVEIAKLYSTPKSKDFVNGILDRLMKSLQEQGRIQKTGRGLLS